MSKEERLLKQAKTSVESAKSILDGETIESIEYMVVTNAAAQAMQAAADLYKLAGMIDKERR